MADGALTRRPLLTRRRERLSTFFTPTVRSVAVYNTSFFVGAVGTAPGATPGAGGGGTKTGTGGALVFGEPWPQPTAATASTTAKAAAAAVTFRRLGRRTGRWPRGLSGLMPAIAVLPSGKDELLPSNLADCVTKR